MNPPKFESKVRAKVIYKEYGANGESLETNEAKKENYDFAAKFRKGRDTTGKSKTSVSEKSKVKESVKEVPMKESLVVENDPNALKVTFNQPKSKAFSFFFKSVVFETFYIPPFLIGVGLIVGCIILAIAMNFNSNDISYYSLDYQTMSLN